VTDPWFVVALALGWALLGALLAAYVRHRNALFLADRMRRAIRNLQRARNAYTLYVRNITLYKGQGPVSLMNDHVGFALDELGGRDGDPNDPEQQP